MIDFINILKNLKRNLNKKSRSLLFITFLIGILSAICESFGVLAVSKIDYTNILNDLTIDKAAVISSYGIAFLALILTCILNLAKLRFTVITSANISCNLSNAIFNTFISSPSDNKKKQETINFSKNATKELGRRYLAPLLLFPSQIICALAIFVSLSITSSIEVLFLLLIGFTLNFFLAYMYGIRSDKLLKESIEIDEKIESKVNNFIYLSDEITVNRTFNENKENLNKVILDSRSRFMLSQYTVRVAGVTTPLINFGIIVYVLSTSLIDNQQILALVFAMQRGNASLSSVISSISSLLAGSSSIKKVFDIINNKPYHNNYFYFPKEKDKNIKESIAGIILYFQSDKQNIECKKENKILEKEVKNKSSITKKIIPINNGIITISGPSGSGKTTYLKNIIGLTEKKDLCINFLLKSKKEIPIFSNLTNGYYCSHNIPELKMTLKEYLLEGNKNIESTRSLELLKELFLFNKNHKILWFDTKDFDSWISSPLSKISLGEKNRVKLLKAFIDKPFWYALDEPTNGLDMVSSKSVINSIDLLSKNSIFIIITHDKNIIEIADYNISFN